MKGLIRKGRYFAYQAGIPKDVRQHFDGRKKYQKTFRTTDQIHAERLAAEADRMFTISVLGHRQRALDGKSLPPERKHQVIGWLFGQYVSQTVHEFQDLRTLLSSTIFEGHMDQNPIVDGIDREGVLFDEIATAVEHLLENAEGGIGYYNKDMRVPQRPTATMKGACEAWAKKARHTPKTIAQYTKDVRAFTDWFEPFNGPCYGVKITPRHVNAFVQNLMQKNAAKATIGRALSALRLVYKSGQFSDTNPFSGVNDRMVIEGDQLKVRDFTDAEVRMLIDPKHLDHPAIMIAAYSGMRLSEIAALRKRNVEKVGDVRVFNLITAGKRKTKAAYRKVPIHPTLYTKVIRGLLTKRDTDDFLIDGGTTDALSKRINRIIDLVTPDPSVRAHSLRHTFITKLAEAGVPRELRMAIAGHEGSDAHDRYTHASFITELSRKIVKVRYD